MQENCPHCSNPNFKSICDVLNCANEIESEAARNCVTSDYVEEEDVNCMSYPLCAVQYCPNCGRFHSNNVDENGYNPECQCADCCPDKRLDRWTTTLSDRHRIADRIMRCTGKRHSQLLFNRSSTVDDRDKQMVKRILEQAERQQRKCLQRLQNCVRLEPNNAGFEIIGLSAVAKEELLGENSCQHRASWATSTALQQHMQTHKDAIKKVVAFFPDIENLQVIGKQMKIGVKLENAGGYEAEISVKGTDSSAVRIEVDQTSESASLDRTSKTAVEEAESLPNDLEEKQARLKNLYLEFEPIEKRANSIQKNNTQYESALSHQFANIVERDTQFETIQNDTIENDMVDVLILDSSRNSLFKTTSNEEKRMTVQNLYCENDISQPETEMVVDVEYVHAAPDICVQLTYNKLENTCINQYLAPNMNEQAVEIATHQIDPEGDCTHIQVGNLSSEPHLFDLTKECSEIQEQEPRLNNINSPPNRMDPIEETQRESRAQNLYLKADQTEQRAISSHGARKSQRDSGVQTSYSSPSQKEGRTKIIPGALIQGIDRRSMNSMIFESFVVAPSEYSVGELKDDSTERMMARTEKRMTEANSPVRMLESIDTLNTLDFMDNIVTDTNSDNRRMIGSTSAIAKLFLSRNGNWASGER